MYSILMKNPQSDYCRPEGRGPYDPEILVSPEVITALGTPEVDYNGLFNVFDRYNVAEEGIAPYVQLSRIYTPGNDRLQSSYGGILGRIVIDPVTMAKNGDPADAIVREIAWGASLRQQYSIHAALSLLPLSTSFSL
jgi:hypothetical protein